MDVLKRMAVGLVMVTGMVCVLAAISGTLVLVVAAASHWLGKDVVVIAGLSVVGVGAVGLLLRAAWLIGGDVLEGRER